jgi:hypothetical protein
METISIHDLGPCGGVIALALAQRSITDWRNREDKPLLDRPTFPAERGRCSSFRTAT